MALFNKFFLGLKKTRENFFSKLDNLFGRYKKIDDEFFDELEEILILSDIGAKTAIEIINDVKKVCRKKKYLEIKEVKEILLDEIEKIFEICDGEEKFDFKTPTVILIVGVNGAGKTTSIGKLGNLLKNRGKKVMFVAADTFRAAAIEQLEIWADRIKVPIVKQKENSDPGAVVFDAIKSAKAKGIDVLICDTAGRLQNKINLMNELKKIFKIVNEGFLGEKAQIEVFLSIDATMGQNAIQQAKLFNEACDLTGIILTKLDSSAKGGMIIPIVKELKIPVRFVGVGEKIEDIQEFDYKSFVLALLNKNEES